MLLDFIEHRLMPRVNKRFKVDLDQRSLFGWSVGGMFGIYALFTRPALFQHVVAISPSLWWRDRYLLRVFFLLMDDVGGRGRSLRPAPGVSRAPRTQRKWLPTLRSNFSSMSGRRAPTIKSGSGWSVFRGRLPQAFGLRR